MGWLWACLGGGPTSKEQRNCLKTFIHHQSKGRLNIPSDLNIPLNLRLHQPREEGHGSADHFLKTRACTTSSRKSSSTMMNAAVAVSPLKSESSVRLLDVLVKKSGGGSSPILCNRGPMFQLGSKESQETADRLREGLKRFESNTECEEDDEELFQLDRAQLDIKHTVESRAAVKSSLRIFGSAANLDIDDDTHLECQLQRVQIASVDRAALEEIIGQQQWKPDVPKLRKLKYRSKPRGGVFNGFGESVQDLWVIYEVLQAKKVILESVDSHSGAVGADITAVVPVGGPPVGANLRMSATKKTLFEYTVPDNKARAFGFRAIHARYDSTGEFFSFGHVEEWSALPTVPSEHESKNIDPPLDLGGLFLKPPADMHDDDGDDIECLEIEGQRDTLASSLTSSSNEPVPPSEEHPSLQQLRDGSDPSTVGALVGTTTTQDFSTQATTPGMGSGKDSQLESHEAAHEMNEPSKLEPNCGASSSRSLPPILQQSLKETAGGTTNLGKADTESEQIDIELEACVQQDGNGKQCKDEAAGRQAQKLLSSIHQRLQGLERAIGVIPTPADYVVEDHCVEHDSESVITFGWRVASEANALELLFRSKTGMSSILGVGVEFAKVLVVPASLEVKIIGIGHASWNALWQDSSNNKDDVFDIVSIGGVRRTGAKLENPSNVEYLTAKQSATKYGVGLQDRSNTAHVNSTDVQPQSDCSCILDKVLEYLVLKKVIDAIVDKQCDGGEGSSSGVNGTKQDIGGRSSSQSTLSLLMSYFPFHGAQKPTGGSDDDDDDETLPSREGPHQVNHKRPKGNFCRVTVHPGPGGSFDRAGTPQELGTTSIDPTLVFEFNYKLDMNGIICDKQIHITTTTAFDLGEAAPTKLMSDSFGWYQNPLEVSLRNCGDAKLHSCQLKETLKETKISAKTTHTHSKNSTLQRAAQVEGDSKTFIQVTGSANRTTSNGETIAKETASENSVSEVLKGFQHRDLRVGLNSLLKYRFSGRDPPIPVLEDPEERHKYRGTGMCEAVVPTCIGTWLIRAEDVNEHSPYLFDAERTLNRIFKVDQGSKRRQDFFKRTLNRIFKVGQGSERREKFVQRCHEEFVQHYRVPIYVNHAMSHLRALKDDHKLEGRKLSNVLEVGIVGI